MSIPIKLISDFLLFLIRIKTTHDDFLSGLDSFSGGVILITYKNIMQSSPVCKQCKKLTIGIHNGVCVVCRAKPWNPNEKKEEKGKGYPNATGAYFSKQQSGPKQQK